MSNSGTGQTNTYSWNFGDFVYLYPLATKRCSDTSAGPAGCSRFANVGETWEIDEEAGEEVKTQVAYKPDLSYGETGETIDDETMTYDPRFLVGNYYQSLALTAGSASTTANTVAESSICPRGWRLASYNPSATYKFEANEVFILLNNQGVNIRITEQPLYFVPAGVVNRGKLTDAGTNMRIASSSTGSRYMRACMGSSGVKTSDFGVGSQSFYNGVNVRCILRNTEEQCLYNLVR